ncbi:MAG: hypothetical protein JXD19_06385 [Deltaproteobacteria bacterium]|nr:hypothetical protein [Deltaproteobacteria bacterium]
MSTGYQHAGVNIRLGDEASRILYEAARQTWSNRSGRLGEVITPFDDFTGIRMIDIGSLPPGTLMAMGFDGVGTKVEIAERTAKHDTVAYDLFAMVCDDAVIRGGEPILVGTVLDVNTLGGEEHSYLDFIRALAQGYVNAAQEAGVAVINGELAELGARVQGFGPFNYNWCAGVVWFAQRERMFTGFEIEPGDALVGLREQGFRSNGLSLVRSILSTHLGDAWQTRSWNEKKIADWVLTPSRIYTKPVAAMFGGVEGEPRAHLHGVAHITGGGVPGKLGRILKPRNLGAHLDNLFPPGEFVLYCQELGSVPDNEAYRTWNMGQGMIIATPKPEEVIAVANEHEVETRIVGTVTGTPGITLVSRGVFQNGKTLKFI